MEYVTIASTGNATSFGDLTQNRQVEERVVRQDSNSGSFLQQHS